jgi:hypothetical protein
MSASAYPRNLYEDSGLLWLFRSAAQTLALLLKGCPIRLEAVHWVCLQQAWMLWSWSAGPQFLSAWEEPRKVAEVEFQGRIQLPGGVGAV